jgi:PAS domain S-box-containing protein
MSLVDSKRFDRSMSRRDTAAGQADDGPELQSILSTAELSRRPSRPPDYAAENRALLILTQEMATSPGGILQKLADTALGLCRAHSAGLSLLEDDDQRSHFHWRAIAGQWAPHLNGGTPRNFGPCGTVLDRNVALMCSHPERDFPYFGEVTPLLEEALLVPFYINGEAVGTIWVVAHDESRRFDAEDLRVMTNLSTFAASAYQTVLALNATQRIASIVETSDDAIISKDLNGVITTWNGGAERIFGYAAEQIIGKPVNILIPPDRQDEEPVILERIRRGERIDHYETVRLHKHGNRLDLSITVSPIMSVDGNIIGASKIARDITEQKRTQEGLLRAEQEFRDFVENAAIGMHWVGPDGIILWANRTEMEMLGYAREEYIGHHIAEFYVEQPAIEDVLRRLTNRETLCNYEASLRCKDGSSRDVLINSNVLWEGDKFIHTRCFTRDVTERRKSNAQIAILGREAEHRTKNVLATVQATVRLSRADTPDGLKQAIDGRIQALANVHSLFVHSRWTGAELRNLITQELSPYCQDGETRVLVEGPNFLLEPNTAQTIAVTVHELATNAAKYGALSAPAGKIHVGWSRAADGGLALRWIESGGPLVKPSTHRGFGTRVMEGMIRDQLKGEMRFDWRPEGLVCEIVLPARN